MEVLFPSNTLCLKDLSAPLHVLTHLILKTTSWGRCYYYPHFYDWGYWGIEMLNNLPMVNTAGKGQEESQALEFIF